ncbi:MAG TPA: Hsp20/alpha crystallin family protein [Phycisphaerae bacterium]|nr:Hsp20/alpha crystallin family protein [Phycisphaerae bacterium]HUT61155.1 Hsp20/alpha crystallin family protein [Phycisphaerae bacterium]
MVSAQASHSKSDAVTRKMIHWVDQVLSPGFQKYSPGSAWTPSINLYEDDRRYYVVVDLAGVNAEEIELRVEEDVLVLTGLRETPRPHDTCGPLHLHLMEVDHDQFSRTLRLPQNIDADAIEASYRNGYLWVRVPKKT